jgi:hypothetical protein
MKRALQPEEAMMRIDSVSFALGVLAAMPASVRGLVTALPHELLDWHPAPDAWSVRDILAHLLDAETAVTRPRIEMMIAADDPLLATAPLTTPTGETLTLLEEWATARAAHLTFLKSLTADQLARTGRHARIGTLSVRDLVIELAYHDQDHLRQIVANIQAALYPDMGRFYDLYPPPG